MLYLITNRKLANQDFLHVIAEAVRGGIDAVILREKDLSSEELLPMAKEIQKIIKGTTVKLIVNSNLTVAEEINAHGYHIGFQDFIEKKPKFHGLVGVSVHSLQEAVEAEKNGASYLLVSHIFPTACKQGLKPKGIGFIQEVKQQVRIPIIALGGIQVENTKEVMQAGAHGIAVMSSIMAAPAPYTATKAFLYVLSDGTSYYK